MPQEIGELIEKINQEGIQAAHQKAQAIEAETKKKTQELLEQAKREAERVTEEAQKKISQMQEKEKILLAQAGRDLLISLKKEINAMLERIIVAQVRESLNPEALYKIISDLVKQYNSSQASDNIVITLKKEDLELLEKRFFTRLKEETRKGITLRSAEEILGGFTISFDHGKSCYDFTDRSLAEYIGAYLKPKLNQILQDAVSGPK